jgi:hypothetical protein
MKQSKNLLFAIDVWVYASTRCFAGTFNAPSHQLSLNGTERFDDDIIYINCRYTPAVAESSR